ncbi:hypothetical protein TraAM80_02541 [Trypanosoma rangeli]|uniref:Uncharacterized protein n=1 Tax=Trypanosoma rangeli TaxID=5698 RepID=A0A3R7L6V4_TRYRA|nr:uncharacterized protein TraAM80_02541 [Trypanosoma rangeli]RNF08799.1 hypothetical protein TraAM80_02541 [Trypanosoma rangeli]|eukprot:RNF08799.1 hypothetical protein TraAM80_02541 [Trypanosoma rangeli]
MVRDASTNWLLLLLERLRRAAAQLKSRPTYEQDQAEYAAAVQLLELQVLALESDEWRALAGSGAVAEVVGFAVESVLEDPLSCFAVQAWAGAMDALLARANPAVSAAHHVPRLWDAAKRLAKDRGGNNATLQAALTLLRVVLKRCPADVDCVPRHNLPHPVKTVAVAPRVAALELLPYLILQPHKYIQQQQQQQRQKQYAQEERTGGGPTPPSLLLPRRPLLAAAWLDYLRKAMACPLLVVRKRAVESICDLLKGGVVLEASQSAAMLDMLMSLAKSDDISCRLENDVGTAIGCLLAAARDGIDWTRFAAATDAESADIIRHMFNPRAMNHATQRVLSVAIGELLLQTVSLDSMGRAVSRLFELLQPVPHDDRMYMPTIVSRAVLLWASRVGSDMFRGAVVRSLIRFLDASCAKSVTHTALLCVTGVVRMVLATSEFAAALWAQLLRIPMRHPSLLQVTSRAMACLAQHNEMCGRALLRDLYTASSEVEPDKPLSPSFSLHAKALLVMPAEFVRRRCVLEILLEIVATFSIDIPPTEVKGFFLRHVEYFNRLALLLLKHQRGQLSPVTIANVRTSVRAFLSLLVSNPSGTSLCGHAASSACAVLMEVGASDTELKLVVALLETLDTASVSLQRDVRSAAYALLTRASWSACTDGTGRRGVVMQALADLSGANRNSLPCLAEEQGDTAEVEGARLLGVAAECLDEYQRLLPSMTQKAEANATWHAVCLVVAGCTECVEEGCRKVVLDSLREWCAAAEGEPMVTAWNVLCCLNCLFVRCDSALEWVTAEATEWFTFVEDHWLSSSVWAVRLAAAQVLARLAAITGRRDEFTSVAVKNFSTGVDVHHISGVLLALGEMHRTDSSATASMAISFVLRVLKQHGVWGETAVVAAALVAMTRMVPHHSAQVHAVVSTVLMPQLLSPATTAAVDPFVLVLLLELFLLVVPHMPPATHPSVSICVRGVVSAVVSSRALSEEATSAVLNMLRHATAEPQRPLMKVMASVVATSPPVLDPLALKKEVLGLLESNGCSNDLVSRAAADMMGVCCSATTTVNSLWMSLGRLAQMIDAAASLETRHAWINVARIVLHGADGAHLGACQEEMELIMRGKPVHQPHDGEAVAREPLVTSGREEGMGGLSASREKKGNEAKDGDAAKAGVVTSEVGAKLAVLSLLTEMVQQPHLCVRLEDELLERRLHLLVSCASLVEVEPLFIRPAVDALLAVVDRYGQRAKDAATPFLTPWRVVLVSGIRRIIQRSLFCCAESCQLAESFIQCNLADDASVRRVVVALRTLLETLEGCEADDDAVAHGGCGRIILALSACRTQAVAAHWLQAEQAASEAMASMSGQAAATLVCNRLTTSLAMMHGFKPAYDMIPTPLDDCGYATPNDALSMLENMCSALEVLGPTVRHTAGCLLCLLLCTPGVVLRPMQTIVPLLSTTHQEAMVSMAFGLLLQEDEDALSDEDATLVLEIAAATNCRKCATEVESLLLVLATHHRPCVGSLASLRLAAEASCSVDSMNLVLQSLNVDVLLASSEPTTITTVYMQHLSGEERRWMALESACGFLLMLLIHSTDDQQLLFAGSRVMHAALSRLMEALAQSTDPLGLLRRVFPAMPHDVRLCGTVLAACSSARRPELRRRWAPCVEHALLCIIHAETLQQEQHSPQVLERIRLFIRALLMLVVEAGTTSHADATDEVGSHYPDACAVLTQQLMHLYSDELKSIIQSLSSEEAVLLRRLMQLKSRGEAPHASPAAVEREAQQKRTAAAVPHRLSINLSLYT